MTEVELIEKIARGMAPEMTDKPWECECTEKRGTNCDCGDAMIEERVDRYDEDLCRDDVRIYARAALAAIREAGCVIVPSNIRRAFYYPIEMPVTKDGQGPATVGVDAEQITYEVWDQLLASHGSHNNLPDAINQANALNDRDIYYASPLKGENNVRG
jgi:hypothetical protein